MNRTDRGAVRVPKKSSAGAFLTLGTMLLVVAAVCFFVHQRNNRYLLDATAFIFRAPGDEESKAKALAHFVAVRGTQAIDPESASFGAKLEHSLPLELSPVTVLKEGFAFPDARRFGPCGQLARTIRAVAWLRNIRSHKVLIGNGTEEHAMVSLYANGAYRLFDPTYDFFWTDRAGHVATLEEVRDDSTIFAQVYRKVPRYPYHFGDATYFRWSRLRGPGSLIRRTLVATMGARWVANLDTPKLYDRPWWGYLWASLSTGLACLATGLALLARGRLPASVRSAQPALDPSIQEQSGTSS